MKSPYQNLAHFFYFCTVLCFGLIFSFQSRAFIGGQAPQKPMNGLVTLNNKTCTGVFVDSQTILTALHCISKSPQGILNINGARLISGPNFPDFVNISVQLGGQVFEGSVEVVSANMYVEYYHNHVAPFVGNVSMQDLYNVGDFALLTISQSIEPLMENGITLPKIKFMDFNKLASPLWIGGSGYRGPMGVLRFPEEYHGSFVDFVVENLVKIKIINQGKEVSYLGPGDSGGPLYLLKDGHPSVVVGVNHSSEVSHVSDFSILKMDEATGMVMERPKAEEWAQSVGNVNVFDKNNKPLLDWVRETAPQVLAN